MRLVSIIPNCKKIIFFCLFFLVTIQINTAQENSPYSRYGIGDVLPSQNIITRAMGGASASYYDPFSVNFINPASYSRLRFTTFDVGVDYTGRTLRTVDPVRTLSSGYLIPSYVQIGIPLKKNHWGMNIGIRPISRISYAMQQNQRLPGIDSVITSFTGDGGSYQAYLGTGIGTKNFSVGVNAGYMFGSKNYITERTFANDSVIYEKGKWADSAHFGGLFAHVGAQYMARLSKTMSLKLGAYAQLQNSLSATRNILTETFEYSQTQGQMQKDSVSLIGNQKGKIVLPATYGFGFTLEKDLTWSVNAEYSLTNWTDYRYYDQEDEVQNTWTFRMGGSLIPNYKSNKYWGLVQYRAGFYIGPDYVTVNKNLPMYAITFGASFPVRKYGYHLYSGQATTINTSFEIGSRGNKNNSLRESFYRISVGLSLSDIWFNKRSYQ